MSGANDPSNAADPIVNASAPAAFNARICAALPTLPATSRNPGVPRRAARTSSIGSASVARAYPRILGNLEPQEVRILDALANNIVDMPSPIFSAR